MRNGPKNLLKTFLLKTVLVADEFCQKAFTFLHVVAHVSEERDEDAGIGIAL